MVFQCISSMTMIPWNRHGTDWKLLTVDCRRLAPIQVISTIYIHDRVGMQRRVGHFSGSWGSWWWWSWRVVVFAEEELTQQRSEMKSAEQTKSGVKSRMRPKGTIHCWWLLLGWWYLTCHQLNIKPPTKLNVNDPNHPIIHLRLSPLPSLFTSSSSHDDDNNDAISRYYLPSFYSLASINCLPQRQRERER